MRIFLITFDLRKNKDSSNYEDILNFLQKNEHCESAEYAINNTIIIEYDGTPKGLEDLLKEKFEKLKSKQQISSYVHVVVEINGMSTTTGIADHMTNMRKKYSLLKNS